MDSFEFRRIMIEKIRAFESYAWKDSNENPDDYQGLDFDGWLQLFNEYAETEVV